MILFIQSKLFLIFYIETHIIFYLITEALFEKQAFLKKKYNMLFMVQLFKKSKPATLQEMLQCVLVIPTKYLLTLLHRLVSVPIKQSQQVISLKIILHHLLNRHTFQFNSRHFPFQF